MNDVEQRLAAWLHQETPEPPRLLTAAEIIGTPERDVSAARRLMRRRWLPVLAAAVVVAVTIAVLAVVASTRGGGHSKPATSVSPTQPAPTFTGGIAEPPADFSQTRLVGASGRYAWKLTEILRLTADAGASWSQVALPSGVTPAAVDQIQVAADGAVFLVDSHRDRTLDFYRRPTGGTQWAVTTLAPLTPGNYALPFVGGISAEGHLVMVLVDWGTMPTRAYSELLVSTDGGATFTQRPTRLDSYTYDPLFLDAETGLLIAGAADNLVYRTTDGGRHWTQVLGGPVSDGVSFGPLAKRDSDVVLSRINDTRNEVDVAVYRSTDDGATFARIAEPLRLRNRFFEERFVSVLDHTVWVMTQDRVYESNDDGATWTHVDVYQHIRNIELASTRSATGLASANCSSDTEGCWTTDYLVATSDGGRTWHSL
jgi:photosystem II stability/assembly factor-like uncharacterized protein